MHIPTLPTLARDHFPTFSIRERDRRYTWVRELIRESGVSALIVYGERDGAAGPQFNPDVYLTNDRPGSIVIFPADGMPLVNVWSTNPIADHMEAGRRGDERWVGDDQFRVGRGPEQLLASLRELGVERGPIGVIGIDPVAPFYPTGLFPYGTIAALTEALPNTEFVPLWTPFLNRLMQRSDEEIEVVRKSASAGEAMSEAALAVTRVGATETEIFAAAMEAGHRHGAVPGWMIMVTGGDNLSWGPPAWTYRPQAPRTIENGDVVMLELFPIYAGYETQQQLTIAVGDVHPDTERAAIGARAAYDAGLEFLREGVVFQDLVDAMSAPLAEAGGWNLTPNVHTLPGDVVGDYGFATPLPELAKYPGAGRNPAKRPETVLRRGMVFAFEPNCVIGRRRVNIGGTVVFTGGGCVQLNTLCNTLQRV